MPTEKKYLSLDKLQKYDAKIKALIDAKDAAQLQESKNYSDSLAENYEKAGAVATAQTALQQNIDTVSSVANQNKTDIAAINNETTGILATAKAHTDTSIATVQGAVDALETLVGELPEGDAKTVIEYINAKTEGIATDAALGELQDTVNQLDTDLGVVEGKVATIEGDYLKAADKTELQGNIDAVGAKVNTLVGSDANKSVRTIANEELAAQLLSGDAEADFKTLQELAAWLENHPEDVTAINLSISNLQALVGTLPEGIDETNVVDYIEALVAEEKTRAEGAESSLSGRIATLEGKFGGAEGSVEDQIADAQTAAVASAKEYADTQDGVTLAAAKKYADDEDAKIEQSIATLQGVVDGKATQADLTALTNRVSTAEGEIDTLQADLDAAELLIAANDAAIKANQQAIALKASQADLDSLTARVAANESEIASFVEISDSEINNLFA